MGCVYCGVHEFCPIIFLEENFPFFLCDSFPHQNTGMNWCLCYVHSNLVCTKVDASVCRGLGYHN